MHYINYSRQFPALAVVSAFPLSVSLFGGLSAQWRCVRLRDELPQASCGLSIRARSLAETHNDAVKQ